MRANGERGAARGFARFAAALTAAAFSMPAAAQHATAFDVEDGRRVYQASCATCHGPDGNLIAGIDFARGVYRRPFTNDELVQLIIAGIPNTPMPPNPTMSREQALRVVEYLRSLAEGREGSASGDARRGRALFEGKGECRDCHAVRGEGSRLGPDLTNIGAVRRAAELERSLLDPEAEVQPENRFYRVQPRDGRPVVGRLLNRDTFTVQLIDFDERLRSFEIASLREHGFEKTPMPAASEKLSAAEIVDVVSYLLSLRGEAAP